MEYQLKSNKGSKEKVNVKKEQYKKRFYGERKGIKTQKTG